MKLFTLAINRPLFLLVSAVLLCACNDENTKQAKVEASTSSATVKKTYRVATSVDFPPFVQRGAKGEAIGLDIELLDAIAEEQNIQFTYELRKWDGIFNDLNAGKYDVVATVFVTPERRQSLALSQSYMDMRWALALKDRKAEGVMPFQSFDEALKNIKVFTTEFGTGAYERLQEKTKGSNIKIVESVSPYAEIATVLKKEAQAAFDGSRTLQYYAKTRSGAEQTKLYVLVDNNVEPTEIAFALKKGRRDDLMNQINAGLEKIKANGKYNQIKEKWIGVE